MSESNSERHDVAQICLNGHIVNASSTQLPEFNSTFCEKCGAKTIDACPSCAAPIRGAYLATYSKTELPAFCHACGKSFPWTDTAIEASVHLATELGHLDATEASQFEEAVNELIRESPRMPIAASRFKKLLAKVGTETAPIIRDTLTDMLSETAKKMLFGQK